MKMLKRLLFIPLFILLPLALFPSPYAAPLYRWEEIGGTSDTAYFVSMNDVGDLVIQGYADSLGDTGSRIIYRRTPPPWEGDLVKGLSGLFNGVRVELTNSQGDMIGESLLDGSSVRTFWRDGIPYDLTDPANSDLAFVPDPIAHQGLFTFADFNIVNTLPLKWFDFELSRYEEWLNTPQVAWTNAKGEYALAPILSGCPFGNCSTVVLVPIPEPASLSIVLIGFVVIGFLHSRQHKKRLLRIR